VARVEICEGDKKLGLSTVILCMKRYKEGIKHTIDALLLGESCFEGSKALSGA
jgi:hypothetical protein